MSSVMPASVRGAVTSGGRVVSTAAIGEGEEGCSTMAVALFVARGAGAGGWGRLIAAVGADLGQVGHLGTHVDFLQDLVGTAIGGEPAERARGIVAVAEHD